MTPQDAIEHIEMTFPFLVLRRSKTQSAFFLCESVDSGRVVRVEHGGANPVKLAASSLEARRAGLDDGPQFLRALPDTFTELEALVDSELKVAEAPKNSGQFKNWEQALAALTHLGGNATREHITQQVLLANPKFADPDNVRKDLIMLSVNDEKRRAYRAHNTMRGGGRAQRYLDRVFKGTGEGKDTTYEIYDPVTHGVWVGRGNGAAWHLKREGAMVADLVASTDVEFDPDSAVDGKVKVAREIAVRQGQQKFRQGLLAAYGGRCCVSGCAITELLEAAHITPYNGLATNALDNGLLLRTDLHTLFDLGLMRMEPNAMRIEMHASVVGDAEYAKFHGALAAKATGHVPSQKAI